MSSPDYLLGLGRLALLLIPALAAARVLRSALVTVPSRSLGWLVDITGAVSVLVIASELLGLVALNRWWALTALLCMATGVAVVVVRSRTAPSIPDREREAGRETAPASAHRPQLGVAAAATTVVAAQWALGTANAYGGGIQSFDSLWYHLPFAAFFAQTGSVSRVLFTQADPFVAYYPANAELLHGLGMIAMHGDLLSPALNLVWLALALLAAWCFGRPWHSEPLSLTIGCLIMGLPILGAGQPGTAFNDIFGLAFLMVAFALIAQADHRPPMVVALGLALGLALGTKVTFAAPVLILVVGVALVSPRGARLRTLGLAGVPCLLAGGWWYLRAMLDTGSPLGLRVHIGPLVLPGPNSPLANAASQTVLSALGQPHLWGARLGPGLNDAFGPLWAVIVAAAALALLAAVVGRSPASLRMIAAAGVVAAVAYLVFPTGASAIEAQTQLFAVNLRYLTPALVAGLLVGVALVAVRRPQLLTPLAPLLLAVLLITQLQAQLWPRQTARHAAFLLAAAAGVAIVSAVVRRPPRPTILRAGAAVAAVVCVAAGFGLAHHYFARRYLSAGTATPIGHIDQWAQGISHARLGLYGTVEQYPLYGARVTNRVDYLGQARPNGGYGPVATCGAWRALLHRADDQYVIVTPAPTVAVPPSWTANDAAATLVLQPAPGYAVYRLDPSVAPTPC